MFNGHSLYGHSLETWIVFHLIILFLLAMDLGVFNKKSHIIGIKEALGWSAFWVAIGLSYGGYVFWHDGSKAGFEYLTGYVVEKSLSVDNLFVFAAIFSSFQIKRIYQHRLLFWGVIGAIVLRAVMIIAGTELLERFHWLLYLFGAFLVYTGITFLKDKAEEKDPSKSKLLVFLRRFLPFSSQPHEGRMMVRESGRFKATDLFAVLIVIEVSDVIFALDSVPAVFGVTKDPYIVYTSNVFAILGLRSLFFVLEDLLVRFHLLKKGLAVVLMFVGAKMIAEPWQSIPSHVSLGIILLTLIAACGLSLLIPKRVET